MILKRLKNLWALSALDVYTSTAGMVFLKKPSGIKRPATILQDNQLINSDHD